MIRALLQNRQNHQQLAVIEHDQEISYQMLHAKAAALGAQLCKNQHEIIAIFLPNSSNYIAAFWGVIQLGKQALPLNILMTANEVAPVLKQASITTVITTAPYRPLFDGLFVHGQALPLDIIDMDALLLDNSPCNTTVQSAVDSTAPMVLFSTSGTTGKSKIVQLSEQNVASCVAGYLDKLSFEPFGEIRYVLTVPFSSTYAIMALSACLLKSFPIVIPKQSLTLGDLYQAVQTHKVTHYEGSTVFIELMEQTAGRPIPYDISSLQYLGFGGAKVSKEKIEHLMDVFPNVGMYQGYGMTEASPLIAKHPQDEPFTKPDSVGSAIISTEIAVDIEGQITHQPYAKGEIVVKGPHIMLGYYQDEIQTAQTLKNGYLYTGDIGYLDEDGYLYICGRKKNIIIIRGFNVYPEEVETCIQNSGLVTDCYVYGELDAQGKEQMIAQMVPIHAQVSKDEIMRYCQTHLAPYKWPKMIAFCEQLARTATGKIERGKGRLL